MPSASSPSTVTVTSRLGREPVFRTVPSMNTVVPSALRVSLIGPTAKSAVVDGGRDSSVRGGGGGDAGFGGGGRGAHPAARAAGSQPRPRPPPAPPPAARRGAPPPPAPAFPRGRTFPA